MTEAQARVILHEVPKSTCATDSCAECEARDALRKHAKRVIKVLKHVRSD